MSKASSCSTTSWWASASGFGKCCNPGCGLTDYDCLETCDKYLRICGQNRYRETRFIKAVSLCLDCDQPEVEGACPAAGRKSGGRQVL